MRKILYIARKEVVAVLTDRNLLLLMFAAPLALATIIGVTFGGVSGDDAPITDIPTAIVNQDSGTNQFNNGAMIVDLLVPAEQTFVEENANPDCPLPQRDPEATQDNDLLRLINAVELDDPAVAQGCVRDGVYSAAVVIPESFSSDLAYSATNTEITPTRIDIYGHPARPISTNIVASVVESIANGMATGNIAVAAVVDTLIETNPLRIAGVTSSETFQEGVQQISSGNTDLIAIRQRTMQGSDAVGFDPFVVFGSAQALFFAIFAANFGATSIIEERRNWTLQRLLITPTPRVAILLGKMLGTFVTILVELGFLLIAFTLVGSIVSGEFRFIWGTNIIGIVVVLLSASVGVTGLGAIIAAVSRTPERAGVVGSVLAIGMAVLGGGFGFRLDPPVSYLSIIYWGSDAFMTLSNNGTDIWLNVLVMALFGVVTFLFALFLFNRHLDE